MLKHKGTYEIISPEDIGLERTNEAGIVLGKLRYAIFFSLEHIYLHGSYTPCKSLFSFQVF